MDKDLANNRNTLLSDVMTSSDEFRA
jgi:hypothetical protein